MSVLVDTSVWSLVLRRNQSDPSLTATISKLIKDQRVKMIGPIRQELLSGIKSSKDFQNLKSKLRAFPDEKLTEEDYEYAAECHILCRSKGIQASHGDFLICAITIRNGFQLFTLDKDFDHLSTVLPLNLGI